MAHQMAQDGAVWSSAMIRLGPHWHKVNWLVLLITASSTGNWWLQSILLYLHVVRQSCMALLIINWPNYSSN